MPMASNIVNLPRSGAYALALPWSDSMSDREKIPMALRQQRRELNPRCPRHRLALFESRARGDGREDSDVDALVEVNMLTPYAAEVMIPSLAEDNRGLGA
jgi:predicted nucleotidyltransferase